MSMSETSMVKRVLPQGWLAKELDAAAREVEAWSPGLRQSFESHFRRARLSPEAKTGEGRE